MSRLTAIMLVLKLYTIEDSCPKRDGGALDAGFPDLGTPSDRADLCASTQAYTFIPLARSSRQTTV